LINRQSSRHFFILNSVNGRCGWKETHGFRPRKLRAS
jgi:hypothetical protein